jgi:hypothetical protein
MADPRLWYLQAAGITPMELAYGERFREYGE